MKKFNSIKEAKEYLGKVDDMTEFMVDDSVFTLGSNDMIMAERIATIYEIKGYKNRDEYLESISEDYGVPVSTVYSIATILGEDEDFDGLISSIEDYS